jgi:glutamyl-tRNA synthetase
MRSDGVPLYNFGAVVDDLTMGITLVARGSDHIINTPKQVLIYQALGAPVPKYAHLPMMLTPDGKKMSKRLGDQQGIDVPVEAYQRKGWLPDAVLNYIARFGWSHGDQEVFTRDELVAAFDWAHCGTMDGRYDTKKALWVSAEHLRREAPEKLAARTAPFLARRGLDVPADGAQLAAAIVPAKPRAQTLVDLADAVDFYFREPPADDPAAVTKFLTPAAAPHLDSLADALAAHEAWDHAALDAALKAWVEARGVTMKEVGQPVRVALSGRAQSPALHEVMAVLGRDVTVQRLRAAARKAAAVA